ncbi:MAG: hypothetical protein QM757_21405 [Paludibaculum sp.]
MGLLVGIVLLNGVSQAATVLQTGGAPDSGFFDCYANARLSDVTSVALAKRAGVVGVKNDATATADSGTSDSSARFT